MRPIWKMLGVIKPEQIPDQRNRHQYIAPSHEVPVA
jgi:hypothetical protein